ncbi:hypothetical protein KAJ27_24110 [bacterium]|nr:hypothetical protein [bacterium]
MHFFFTDNNCDKKELEQLQEELKTKKIIFNITTSASKGGNIGIFNVRETTSASGKLILNFDIGNFSNTPCEISLKLQANSPSGDRILNRKEFIILSGNSTKSFNKSISLRQSAKLHIFFSVIDGENHIECDDGFGTTFTYNKNRQGVYIGSRKYFPYFKKIFHIKNWNIAYYKNIPVNIKLPYPPIWIFHNSFNQNSLKFLTKNSFFMVFGNSPFLKSTPVNADRIVTFNGTHPFLRFCDFSDLSINTPYSINNSFPELDESILATTGNQNIIALLTNSVAGRILAFSFSLNSSNFLKTLSFPIMMENIYDFLKMKKGEVLLYYTGQKWFDANGEIPYLIPGNEKLFFKAINLLDDTESDINSNNKLAFNNSGVISRMKELFHQEIADIILYIVLFFLLFESFIRFIKKRRYIK